MEPSSGTKGTLHACGEFPFAFNHPTNVSTHQHQEEQLQAYTKIQFPGSHAKPTASDSLREYPSSFLFKFPEDFYVSNALDQDFKMSISLLKNRRGRMAE